MAPAVRRVLSMDEKEAIARFILVALPAWFGLPDSTAAYIREARELPLWAAFADGQAVGFITRKDTAVQTAEVHCMGVLPQWHRRGVGSLLMDAFEADCRKDRMRLMQVKTVDEGHYPESYDKTIAFYEKAGFIRLEVFPGMWDEWNPCLVLVKALD